MKTEMEKPREESHTNKRLLNVEEAARYLGISPRTIYNRVARKSKRVFPVRAKRVGRSVRFDINDLDEFITNL